MQFDQLKRRDFIRLMCSAVAMWPLARRIGVLLSLAADDVESLRLANLQPNWPRLRQIALARS
jgi:hypothetical protein